MDEKKYDATHCTNITSPCPIYYFLIKTAQLGKPKTLAVFLFPRAAVSLRHAVFIHSLIFLGQCCFMHTRLNKAKL